VKRAKKVNRFLLIHAYLRGLAQGKREIDFLIHNDFSYFVRATKKDGRFGNWVELPIGNPTADPTP